MRSELAAVAVVLAACGEPRAPAPAPGSGTAVVVARDAAIADAAIDATEIDPEAEQRARELAVFVSTLPPLYAPIFAGTSKDFPGQTLFELPLEIREDTAIMTGTARCYVTPMLFAGGVRGSMICAPYGMGGQVLLFTFDGELIATKDGLWFELFEDSEAPPTLDPKRMLVAARPAPRRHVRVEDGTQTTMTTERDGERWCITAKAASTEYLCLQDGLGIVGGGGTGAGIAASKRTETWGKARSKGW